MKLCVFASGCLDLFGLYPDDPVAPAVGMEDVMFVLLCVFCEFLKDDENVQIMFLCLL